ncbi:GDP-mannose 4,6-dehydratase [Gammaproteobacteria bacterium]|nr:GDP-mannose 4,6-dehydratase [Gammaproteobacteria bacterium]
MDDTFKGKKVFVTGADGFIGSFLVEKLVEIGAQVKALVYYNSWNEIGWLKAASKLTLDKIDIIRGDIRDSELVTQAIANQDYVFHLASLIAIPYSYTAVRSYIDTNIGGTTNVLLACRANQNLIRLLHVSTSEVYGSAQILPIQESHPLVGQSPYSASKIGADKMVESFNRSFELPVVTARPFNTYGPRQTARAVIPTIISQVLNNEKEIKLGALSPKRDFNFVRDTVRGMCALAACKEAEGETVNIGSSEEWSIEETANMIFDIIGHHPEIKTDEERFRPANSEVDRLLADSSRIKTLTDWTSETSFFEGLKETTNWIMANKQYFDHELYAR